MNKDTRNRLILLTSGLFLLAISFLVVRLSYFRIVLNVIGVFLLLILTVYKKKNIYKILPLFFFLFMIVSLFIDCIISISLNRLPIFSYSSTTYGNSKVYNAVGYRIWACEGKELKVDRLYKMGYYCDASEMEALDSNAFLNHVVDNYEEYKGNYIKITGKISKREGVSYIEMQPYQSNSITLNGYVTFSDNITLRIMFKQEAKELANYDVYDNITVVGKILYMKKDNDKYMVYMEDSKILDEMSLNNYEIILSKTPSCETQKKLLYAGADYNFYSYCLDSIIVKYDERNIYEIGSILSSGKLKVDDILSKNVTTEQNPEDGSTTYVFDNYKIIKCSESTGSDVIIGDENFTIYDSYCGINLS